MEEQRHTAGSETGSTWRCPDTQLQVEAIYAVASETETT